jgi:hypothetical protein
MPASSSCPDPERDVHADPIRWPLARCPACGSTDLEPVTERGVEEVHFLCVDCARCWRVELGYVQRMSPASCLGCPHRDRCASVYEDDQRSRPVSSVTPARRW